MVGVEVMVSMTPVSSIAATIHKWKAKSSRVA